MPGFIHVQSDPLCASARSISRISARTSRDFEFHIEYRDLKRMPERDAGGEEAGQRRSHPIIRDLLITARSVRCLINETCLSRSREHRHATIQRTCPNLSSRADTINYLAA